MSGTINWGILSTGAIATCSRNLAASTGKLLAVASRDKAKGDKFAAEFKAEPQLRQLRRAAGRTRTCRPSIRLDA